MAFNKNETEESRITDESKLCQNNQLFHTTQYIKKNILLWVIARFFIFNIKTTMSWSNVSL